MPSVSLSWAGALLAGKVVAISSFSCHQPEWDVSRAGSHDKPIHIGPLVCHAGVLKVQDTESS